jgi:hypothetical protein
MADDDEAGCKVEYLDTADGSPEESNWIVRAGKARVTYVNSNTFEGNFDAERVKQGEGVFTWMKAGEEDDSFVEKAKYSGNYKDGFRSGFGKMVYPNGDIYEGEWTENLMQGEGSYTYKKTNDIYSGTWAGNKKNGEGRYEFGSDSSVLIGNWINGEIGTGTWELIGAGRYEGDFKRGRPFGEGRFDFTNGICQEGVYVVQKVEGEEDEAEVEGEEQGPLNVAWKGRPIVSF